MAVGLGPSSQLESSSNGSIFVYVFEQPSGPLVGALILCLSVDAAIFRTFLGIMGAVHGGEMQFDG